METINKQEAKKELVKLQEQVDKLNSIINKPENICDRIQDLDTLFETLDMDIDFPYSKNTKDSFEKYINSCYLIPLITKAYNESIKLDWDNSNQYKYLPYYKKVSSGWVFDCYNFWYACSGGSASHHFTTNSNCIDACKKFDKYYKDYFSYNG